MATQKSELQSTRQLSFASAWTNRDGTFHSPFLDYETSAAMISAVLDDFTAWGKADLEKNKRLGVRSMQARREREPGVVTPYRLARILGVQQDQVRSWLTGEARPHSKHCLMIIYCYSKRARGEFDPFNFDPQVFWNGSR